jgi:hypothetical protein
VSQCPPRSKSIDCGGQSKASWDANVIVSQEMYCAMAQIRLAELLHFPTLKWARITTAAADVDTREERFIVRIPFAVRMRRSKLGGGAPAPRLVVGGIVCPAIAPGGLWMFMDSAKIVIHRQ